MKKVTLFVIVFAIVVGGVYYAKNYSTFGWEAYENTVYGFSFKYPKSYELIPSTDGVMVGEPIDSISEDSIPGVKFVYYVNTDNKELDDACYVKSTLESPYYGNAIKNLRRVQIADTNAIYVEGYEMGQIVDYCMVKDNYIIHILHDLNYPNADKILSSIRI